MNKYPRHYFLGINCSGDLGCSAVRVACTDNAPAIRSLLQYLLNELHELKQDVVALRLAQCLHFHLFPSQLVDVQLRTHATVPELKIVWVVPLQLHNEVISAQPREERREFPKLLSEVGDLRVFN